MGNRRSLRWQVMAAVVAINLCAALAAMAVTIVNARRATEVEISSSLAIAERFVDETLERLAGQAGGAASLQQLPLHVSGLRHVRIRIEDAQGRVIDVAPGAGEADDDEDGGEVPEWFAALVRVAPEGRDMPVVEGGQVVGHVRVVGEAADEIAEVWHDSSALALLMLVVNIVVLGALYLVLGRLLAPLQALAGGLDELCEGRFGHRVPVPQVRELALIATRFNALGAALKQARDDNERLNERIITVQDDERRQIAADLHDELGPCLFGLRANLESVHRLSARAEPELAGRIGERTATMAEILDRVQHLNRRLLRKIRPMALGHVPLATVIAGLIADFERHSPGRRLRLSVEGLEERYADSVELTVYRCIQEAVTNALRHGDAEQINVRLRAVGDEAAPEGRALVLSIEDDGIGMAPDAAPGFGLIGMGERLSALGGHWRIGPASPRGTRVEMTVPVRMGTVQDEARAEAT
ncbi:histidine kinase [Ancylobacter sp. VKM B-3255]|uniref:histidine kinase n=2 Tax=Ancylobacter radicis TaxID=2836179 RepID=A0ABS5R3Y0_9HYPH|nr:ATP-binding protein [Ancylobacter radicis]MBS9476373.1 histidine kinase [Ancylobacter radicis]